MATKKPIPCKNLQDIGFVNKILITIGTLSCVCAVFSVGLHVELVTKRQHEHAVVGLGSVVVVLVVVFSNFRQA